MKKARKGGLRCNRHTSITSTMCTQIGCGHAAHPVGHPWGETSGISCCSPSQTPRGGDAVANFHMVEGGAFRRPLHGASEDSRCILHGHQVSLVNPESLRRRLRRHVEINDTQPRLQPLPIDYMREEPLEERVQADTELVDLRSAIAQQLPSSRYWKHLAFTPGRRPEPEQEAFAQFAARQQQTGRVLSDGSGPECVLENTHTQWSVPEERLARMEDDFRLFDFRAA
eukprot:6470426-Amphidinium_carterae.2